MCEIMDKIHNHVPAKYVTEKFSLFEREEDLEVDDKLFHQFLLGGDQPTIARARGSIAARLDHITLLPDTPIIFNKE